MVNKNTFKSELPENILKSKNIVYIILMFSVILNMILVRNLLMPQIFGIVYLTVIHKCFDLSIKKYIYYTTLLFSILDFGLIMPITSRIGIYYFYLTLAVYYIMLLLEIKNKIHSFNVKTIAKNKYYVFIIIFTFYVIFSILISQDKKLALKTIITYLVMISYMIMNVIENRNSKELNSTLKFFEYMLIGILILGIVKILGFGPYIRTVYTDMGYTNDSLPFIKRLPIIFFYNPNNYAVFIVIATTLVFIKLFYTDTLKEKAYYYIILFLCMINIIFTSCRTGWITLFVIYFATLCIAFITSNRKLKIHAVKWILISFVVFTTVSFIPGTEEYYGKFNEIPILNKLNFLHKKHVPNVTINDALDINSKGSHSMAERKNLIQDVVQGVILEKHLIGFGAGNTVNYIKTKYNTNQIYNVHSLWFELMGDFGIFIFAYYIYIYLSILIELFKNSLKPKNTEEEKYSLMFGLTLFAFIFLAFAPSTVLSYAPYWILIGLASATVINILQKGKIYENTDNI